MNNYNPRLNGNTAAAETPRSLILKHLRVVEYLVGHLYGMQYASAADYRNMLGAYLPESFSDSELDAKKSLESSMHQAMEVLYTLLHCDEKGCRPLTMNELKWLYDIPAIAKDMETILKFEKIACMSRSRQNALQESVANEIAKMQQKLNGLVRVNTLLSSDATPSKRP